MGHVTAYWEGDGGLSPSGDMAAAKADATAERGGTWTYPLLGEAMAEAGMQEVDTYVARFQSTFDQYISTSTIMDL